SGPRDDPGVAGGGRADLSRTIADEDELPAAIDLRDERIDRRLEGGAIGLVDGQQKRHPRGTDEDAAADAAPDAPKVLVPSRPGRREPRLTGPQPRATHDGHT